eukprot:8428005-Lingulodinium_polyedra.AAC.1
MPSSAVGTSAAAGALMSQYRGPTGSPQPASRPTWKAVSLARMAKIRLHKRTHDRRRLCLSPQRRRREAPQAA